MVRALLLTFALLGVAAPSTPAPSPADVAAQRVIGALDERNAAVRAYSFDISVHIALLTFPWIRFRLDGHGQYQRDGTYAVHFDHVPWFGRGFETIKLDSLDPKNWMKQYTVAEVQQQGDLSVLVMHDRIKSPLTEATATIDATTGVRELMWAYDYGGHVRVTVVPQSISGVNLPNTEDAEIVMPHYRAMAHAAFSNYRVTLDTPAQAR